MDVVGVVLIGVGSNLEASDNSKKLASYMVKMGDEYRLSVRV